MKFEVRPDLAGLFTARDDPFAALPLLRGKVYRELEGRRTLRFYHGPNSYFLKHHTGIGWGEIVKNLLSLRLPVLGATNEYRAIRRLEALGVDTLSIAAFGCKGLNPARQQSFLITDELPPSVTLEDHCAGWPERPPRLRHKRLLIRKVAHISRSLHDNGINHRDYYLCHFHLKTGSSSRPWPVLYLIDLHRAQLRRRTPYRWRLKDVAGLYFSALDIGLTRRDLLLFMREYSGMPLRQALAARARFWRDVERKALRLYRKVHGRRWEGGR